MLLKKILKNLSSYEKKFFNSLGYYEDPPKSNGTTTHGYGDQVEESNPETESDYDRVIRERREEDSKRGYIIADVDDDLYYKRRKEKEKQKQLEQQKKIVEQERRIAQAQIKEEKSNAYLDISKEYHKLSKAKEEALPYLMAEERLEYKKKQDIAEIELKKSKVLLEMSKEYNQLSKEREEVTKQSYEAEKAHLQRMHEIEMKRAETLFQLQEKERGIETMQLRLEQKVRLEEERLKNKTLQAMYDVSMSKFQIEKILERLQHERDMLELRAKQLDQEEELSQDTGYYFDHSNGYFIGKQTGRYFKEVPVEGTKDGITHINRPGGKWK